MGYVACMKFKHVLGECDSKEWCSPIQYSEDYEYFIIIRVVALKEITGQDIYFAEASIVIPELASKRAHEFAEEYKSDCPLEMAAYLFEYGAAVTIWSSSYDNPLQALHGAFVKAKTMPDDFDYLMERPMNAIGTTGWERATW